MALKDIRITPSGNRLRNAGRFIPMGQCIYCLNEEGTPLSDEHIVPACLGGKVILPKASCKKCSGVTSYLEGYCGRNIFYELRLGNNLIKRHKNEHLNRAGFAGGFLV
jgi:hypothetical protein